MSTPDIFEIIRSNEIEQARSMLLADPSLANAKMEGIVSPLIWSVYTNRPEIRDLLLLAGAEVLFHEAAALGNTEALKRWLDSDPQRLNMFSADGWTALHLAAFFGQNAAADFLIAAGAEVNIFSKNATQVMPLHSALSTSRWNIARNLVQHGADIHAPAGESGLTPLHYAAANGSFELVDLFITLEADPHAQSTDGRTPRNYAFENKHFEVAEFLRGKE